MSVTCFWKYILLIHEEAGLIIVTLDYVIHVILCYILWLTVV